MSPFRFPRCMAVALAITAACACVIPVALADSPVTVTFQANNPWTQEVAGLTRRDSSHDYTVEVAAGKTLQVNLVTRNPNVFFMVKNDAQGQPLIDTLKTGATTWSTQNSTATTYTIHVYVQPDAMQRGETANYALQIGRYGQSDMQPATTTVTFEDHKPWVQAVGTLDAQSTARDYTVAIAAGQTLAVNLVTRNPKVHFKVENQASGQTLVDSATAGAAKWSTPVNAATNYTISVYAEPAALPPGSRAGYALQVGQYPQRNAQPTSAGTAATPQPATATSAAVHPHD